MIIHDDGEREDLELSQIKACVLPVKEPFRWPAKEDANKRLSGSSRSVDVSSPRSAADETVPMSLLSLANCAPKLLQDDTDAVANTITEAVVPPRSSPAAASIEVAQAFVSSSAAGDGPLAVAAECTGSTSG